ncbi:MAG: S-adenosylmethionine-binding protein [Burkholderiales bacterium]|nr:S-adenosylmethionine-binding protein [Burkholderiales bacterium]MCW5603014.1 S-adenosylmethionine-binding protein [Burkholderiales bacterium]
MTKIVSIARPTAAQDFAAKVTGLYSTIVADPPWRFENRTGKMAPEHQRLLRYPTMDLEEICEIPVAQVSAENSHLYLWVPNALLAEGLQVMRAWGFKYKSNLVWYKVRKDGGPDGRGVGFYFRNVTELVLFGVRGHMRTLPPGRRQTNIMVSQKREHSRKPDGIYGIVESCSPGPYLELFARFCRSGWSQWGNEDVEQNSRLGKAKRKGHVEQLAMFQRKAQYKVG